MRGTPWQAICKRGTGRAKDGRYGTAAGRHRGGRAGDRRRAFPRQADGGRDGGGRGRRLHRRPRRALLPAAAPSGGAPGRPRSRRWTEVPMEALANDRWRGEFTVTAARPLALLRSSPGSTTSRPGAAICEARRGRAGRGGRPADRRRAGRAGRPSAPRSRRKKADARVLAGLAAEPGGTARMRRRAPPGSRRELAAHGPPRRPRPATAYGRELAVVVDPAAGPLRGLVRDVPALGRRRARARTAPSATSRRGCPTSPAMGFDVLYLPPIHPDRRAPSARGRTTRRPPEPDDVGQPLGDRRRRGRAQGDPSRARHARRLPPLVERAPRARASRSRSTSPSSARPTIPRSASTPSGSAHRPDGTIQYAENPPKKYQDIYPFDFESRRLARRSGTSCKSVFDFWIEQGVRIFRVDNPHTKPFAVLGVGDRRGQARASRT